jgi:hypothetical protein
MTVDMNGWLRDPLVPGQCFLVALVAAGVCEYGPALVSYLAEFSVILLVSLLFFSTTRRLLLRRLFDLVAQTAFLGLLTLCILATVYGRKDHAVAVAPESLWQPALWAAIYCLLSFVPLLLKARRSPNPAREWVRLVVAPNWALPFVLLVALFAGNAAFALVGTESVSTHRLVSTGLMAISAFLRIVFTRILTPRSDGAIDDAYRSFMNPK